MAAAAPQRGEPPDGGYAWVILLAHALNTLLMIQLNFMVGLVFKDVFNELNLSATDVAVILNLHVSFSLLLGMLTGALIRRFGYRKVAATGALVSCVGLLLTSRSNTFFGFVLNYGIVTATGMGLSSPAFTVAFHSYFRRRRSLASSLFSALLGLLGVVSPQVIELLLREYGSRGTCMLLAGLALNVLVAAALLHPVGWHTRAPGDSGVKVLVEDAAGDEESVPGDDFTLPPLPVLKEETDADLRRELYGSLASMRRRASTVSSYHTARRPSEASNAMWASASVLDLEWTGRPNLDQALDKAAHSVTAAPPPKDAPTLLPPPSPRSLCEDVRRCGRFLVDFFDLRLMASPAIAAVMVGLALALFAEGNFHRFLPFILAERGMSTARIANVLSLLALADVVCKLLAPLLHGLLRQSSRTMGAASLVLLVAGRTALVMARNDSAVLASVIALGAFKGFRIVFLMQVVPDSVPPERLAAAIGLQGVLSGLVVLLFGPFIGLIRDQSGSYDMVIMACNAFTLVCLSLWLAESITSAVRRRRRDRSIDWSCGEGTRPVEK